MTHPADSLLESLASALDAERTALLEHDVEALVAAGQCKLAALRGLERDPPAPEAADRVARLSELNRANGALLARRERQVKWLLRMLGRAESLPVYDGRGRVPTRAQPRMLGCG